MNRRQRLGAQGEATAVAHLQQQGYQLLERNYRCPVGEVDAVLVDGETLVFLEVRARRGSAAGTPEESITRAKARHLALAAQTYLEAHGQAEAPWRIDLIALELSRDGSLSRLRHHKSAVEEPPLDA
ncbi:MAG TPA: YraN family protein [Dehalococcoidia bacterium]|nr:YraN family protein [Dehalococcoidia bacterium]